MPCWPMQLGEIVLADVELHFEVVEVGEGDDVALGAAVAHETGGHELALLDGALQDRAGDRGANDRVGEVASRHRRPRPCLLDLAAQGVDLLLARPELHQLVGLLQRIDLATAES